MAVLVDPAACMELPQLGFRHHSHNSGVSDSNVSVDVVNVSVARNALGDSSDSADVSCGTKEPTPTSTLESGAALAGRLPPRDACARRGEPTMPAAPIAGQPGDASADCGQPGAANADMSWQPGVVQMAGRHTMGSPEAHEIPTSEGLKCPVHRADEHSSSTSGGSSGAVLPMTTADPGPPAEEHAEANNTPITATNQPSKTTAVPDQAGKTTPASKKKAAQKTAGTPKSPPSRVDAAQGPDGPSRATAASERKAGATVKEPKKPLAYKFPPQGKCVCDVLMHWYAIVGAVPGHLN